MTIVARKTAEQIKEQKRICLKAKKPGPPGAKRTRLTFQYLKDKFISWGYNLDDDDDKQKKFVEEQNKWLSQCTMLLNDGTVSPRYNDIQSGNTAPANTTPEVIQARRAAGFAQASATIIACGHGQQNHLEKSTFEALMNATGLRDVLTYQWAPDGVQVDAALKRLSTTADAHCPTQLKACYTTDGGQFNFSLTKSDMQTKYAGQLIIAIGYKLGNDDGMLKITHRTLHDAFFSLNVNRNVSKNHKTELIGLKHIMRALPQNTTMTLASDKNKTVDFHFKRGEISLGISAKTATLTNKNPDGTSSGFKFKKGAAPDHDKCDWVLVVYMDTARTMVTGFSAISGTAVYKDDEGKNFCWTKSGSKKGVDYKIKKYPASQLLQVIDLMFEKRGQQITL
ncbi:hypothetical protein JKP88DRAFT_248304 [Tribonema minus]|uniref:Uncharacterized protein n=1 Tax=Tribonema minus TaxID=303371 RepID=A0A835YNP8_9STRA|nr:hypothetical protein JKP88DRAFT_248304 [Tribonema minus]